MAASPVKQFISLSATGYSDDDDDGSSKKSVSFQDEDEDVDLKQLKLPNRKLLRNNKKAPSYLLKEKNLLDLMNSHSIPEEKDKELKSSESSEIRSDASSEIL